MSGFREEKDSMGTVRVPSDKYYGAQTARAAENFRISSLRMPKPFLRALVLIKKAAALVHGELGLLEARTVRAIADACDEAAEGRFDGDFPLDVYQTGSGTSWNMNVNEVIANRANEILGTGKGAKSPVHPNDTVNRGQSSNDVIPSAMNVAAACESLKLIDALQTLADAFDAKAEEFAGVEKIGRTHLQDAVPMTLGQEFSAFARQMACGARAVREVLPRVTELALGGTAVGTGLNCDPRMPEAAAAKLSEWTDLPFRPASNYFEAIGARDSIVALSGVLNGIAVSLMKIANDLRLLSSGPRCGFAEIELPSLQPGSSIMPGKVNPVIPECVIQVCAAVMGKHVTISVGGQTGPLQLNMMMPLMAYEILESLSVLTNAADALAKKCVAGIKADREQCRKQIEWSLAMVTPLALRVGYDKAAQIAYAAYRERITVREAALKMTDIPPQELDTLLNPRFLINRETM